MGRSARHASSPQQKLKIAGFSNLREFSSAYKNLLHSTCGGAWQSYVQRGNWRMVFPFSRRHQEREAANLVARAKTLPIVHIVTFPKLSINHGLLLFDVRQSANTIDFRAYDPNITDRPVSLFFDRATRTFNFPQNHYFAGGSVDIYEIYRSWCF